MNFILFTNIPAPYRVFFFNEFHKVYNDSYKIVYLEKNESNRKWKQPNIKHNHHILNNSNLLCTLRNIFSILKKENPKIIVTCGFNLKMLFCWFYAYALKKEHYILTDSWLLTVNKLTFFHRFIRKIVFKSTSKFICIGKKGREYLMSYGIPENKIYITPLVIDNEKFFKVNKRNRAYDLMFAGQFIERKLPFFFTDIVVKLKKLYPSLRVLIIGNGPLEDNLRDRLDSEKIDYVLPGFIQQDELPNYYSLSKLFLFPTQSDPWGIVANEAIAAGTPVITCDNAGVAGDLVLNNFNGYVLPLDVDIWVKKINELLEDDFKRNYFVNNGVKHIKNHFSVDIAVNNFLKVLK